MEGDRLEKAKEIYEHILSRHSTRDYDLSKPVPDEIIHRLLEAASYAPNPDNYQPWRNIVVRDPETRKLLGDKAIKNCITRFGVQESRSHVLDRFGYMERLRSRERSLQVMATGWRMEYIRDAPVNIVITVDAGTMTGFWPLPIAVIGGSHQTDLMAFISAGTFIQTFFLLAHAMGLGVCVHNFELLDPEDEAEIAKKLEIPQPRWKIASVLAVGYPAKERELGPPRYDPEEVTFDEKFGTEWIPKKKWKKGEWE